MSVEISLENEQFIQQVIDNGTYRNRAEVLAEAIRLLKVRIELIEHIDRGTQQLRNGQFTEYDDESLRAYFDDLQARGQARYEASKKGQ